MSRKAFLYGSILVPLFLISACSGGGDSSQAGGFGGPRAGGQMPPTLIVSEEVVFRQDSDSIESVGTARAKQAATIYPQTAGEVLSIQFESGQFVEKGAVLATLDSAEERLAVARSKVNLQDREQLLARYERIDVDGAISESQIDSAKTAVEAAKIELDLASEALSRRTVRAPFSGHVGLTDIDPGAMITQQTEITRLDDRSVLYVDFALPEQVFGRLQAGDVLPMVPFAASQEVVEGVVTVVDSRIDTARRSFLVRAEVDNSDDSLRPGMSFRVELNLPGNMFPSVPEAAIVWGGDGPYLWSVVDNQAQRVAVTIISRQDGMVLVRAPLEEGDYIIAEGVQKVRQGSPVRTTNAGPTQSERERISGQPSSSAAGR